MARVPARPDAIEKEMKRFLFLLLAFGICGVAPVRADENIRALQTRLKERGFYFGEANGSFDSETAAALTRFQIRNGLEISGQLDAPTAKSLGVTPAAAPQAAAGKPASEAGTWQRLRRTDERFLRNLDQREPARRSRATPVPRRTETARSARQPTEEAVETTQTFKLSRERLRDYVGAFILAGLHPRVDSELEFFGPRVAYFDQGVIGRDQLRRDLISYNERWPQRRFWLAGQVQVEPRADSRLRVTYPMRFELSNGRKRSSGTVQKTLIVEVTGEDLQIVGVNERRVR
jgi:peptidoglycan hydrolase-like protein with peptidoglycan-binding domain